MNKHTPYTYGRGEERTQLLATLRKQYENGASIRGISEKRNIPYSSVRDLLTESGVQLRGRAHHGKRRRRRNVADARGPGADARPLGADGMAKYEQIAGDLCEAMRNRPN